MLPEAVDVVVIGAGNAAMCAALAAHYPIAHVAGHEHIAPGRKFDPGQGFDWAELRSSLAWPAAFFPPENVKV